MQATDSINTSGSIENLIDKCKAKTNFIEDKNSIFKY